MESFSNSQEGRNYQNLVLAIILHSFFMSHYQIPDIHFQLSLHNSNKKKIFNDHHESYK